VGRAISAGAGIADVHPPSLGYTPKAIVIEKLKFGQPDGVTLEGNGNFDRVNSTGKLALRFNDRVACPVDRELIAPFAPSVAARLNALGIGGRSRARQAGARSRQEQGPASRSRRGARRRRTRGAALEGPRHRDDDAARSPRSAALDLDTLRRSEVGVRGEVLGGSAAIRSIALLGLDRAGQRPAKARCNSRDRWVGRGVRRCALNAKLWGAGMDARRARHRRAMGFAGQREFEGPQRQSGADVRSQADGQRAGGTSGLFAHASLAGNKLAFDDLDSVAAGSRLRGRLTLNLDEPKELNGEVGP